MEVKDEKTAAASLYALTQQAHAIELEIIANLGELTPELETSLLNVDLEIREKVDGYKYVIDRLKAASEQWEEREQELRKLRKGCELAAGRLKERIKELMHAKGVDDVKGNQWRFAMVGCTKSLVIDESVLPAGWTMEITQYVPDRERIKQALDSGGEVPGARYEGGKALRSYANREDAPPKKKLKEVPRGTNSTPSA